VTDPTYVYAKVILHNGCGLVTGSKGAIKHSFEECPATKIYLRMARKHQRKLNSNGLVIGKWVTKERLWKALVQTDIGGYRTLIHPNPSQKDWEKEYERAISEDVARLYDTL
jgi:hypothetical protein